MGEDVVPAAEDVLEVVEDAVDTVVAVVEVIIRMGVPRPGDASARCGGGREVFVVRGDGAGH